MTTLLIALAVIAVILFFDVAKKSSRNTNKTENALNYRKKEVMTETERKLYYSICATIDEKWIVLAQVNMSSFLNAGSFYGPAFKKISQKSIDYLICDKSGNPAAAIELQDSTHNNPERQKKDADKAYALATAGMPLIEFHARKLPTVDELRLQLKTFVREQS